MINLTTILLISSISCCYCSGIVELDSLTFDKLLKKFHTALVKFDQQFPYGEGHEAFTAFASQINNSTISETDQSQVLTALVGIKDYGDYDNKQLADRYGINTENIPAIKLFLNGDLDNPINFEIGTEKLTVGRLFMFMKENSNSLVHIPGCVKHLDELAEKFMANEKTRPAILKQVEEFVDKMKCKKKQSLGKTYIVMMKGLIDKGDDFVNQQRERMNKLLKDKLSEKKAEEINQRLNILSSFKIISITFKEEL